MPNLRLIPLFAALVVGMTGAGATARADDAPSAQTLLGTLNGKTGEYACFTRRYDDAHLASHPKQNVRTMAVFISLAPDQEESRIYNLAVGVTFRAAKGHFDISGSCSPDDAKAGAMSCGADCDGGHVAIRQKDNRSILVEIPHGARITDGETADGAPKDAPKNARFWSDDKLFRLDRAPARDCLSIVWDDDLKQKIAKGK